MKATPLVIAALALILGGVGRAKATTILVTTRPAGADLVDWGQLGADLSTSSSPQSFISTNGVTGTVSDNATLERVDQNAVPGVFSNSFWNGNFAPGDHLLWNQDNGNLFTLTFSTPQSQVGAQIMTNVFGPFTGQISAYDSSSNLLGAFTEAGDSEFTTDDSAIYIGVASTGSDISRITFGLVDSDGFANRNVINQLSLGRGVSASPEPASLTLLGLSVFGLMGYAGLRRRKKAAPTA